MVIHHDTLECHKKRKRVAIFKLKVTVRAHQHIAISTVASDLPILLPLHVVYGTSL